MPIPKAPAAASKKTNKVDLDVVGASLVVVFYVGAFSQFWMRFKTCSLNVV